MPISQFFRPLVESKLFIFHDQIQRCLSAWIGRRDLDVDRLSLCVAMIVICIIAATVPLYTATKIGIFLDLEDLLKFNRSEFLLPVAIQYVASFVVTLVVTVATSCYTFRQVTRHGAVNSELSHVVDIGKKSMVTASLSFLSTSCLQVNKGFM